MNDKIKNLKNEVFILKDNINNDDVETLMDSYEISEECLNYVMNNSKDWFDFFFGAFASINEKNNGDIDVSVEEMLKYSVDNNGYKLFLNFIKTELEKFKIFEVKELKEGWVKLGEVIELQQNNKHKASDAEDNGQYNFYTSSNIIKKSNFNDYSYECVIVGSGGNGSLFIDKNFGCSADNFVFTTKDNVNIKYIYYFLKLNFKNLYALYKGNGLKHLSRVELKNFQIPLLSLEHQEEIILFLDEQFTKYDINEYNLTNYNFDIYKFLIEKNYDYVEEILHSMYYKNLSNVKIIDKLEYDKKIFFKSEINKDNFSVKKLNEIVKLQNFNVDIKPKKNSILLFYEMGKWNVQIFKNDDDYFEGVIYFRHKNEITNLFLMNYLKYSRYKNRNLDIMDIKILTLEHQNLINDTIDEITNMQEHHKKYNLMIGNNLEKIKPVEHEFNTDPNKFISLKITNEDINKMNEDIETSITSLTHYLKDVIHHDVMENNFKIMDDIKPLKGYVKKTLNVDKINNFWKINNEYIPKKFKNIKYPSEKLKYLKMREKIFNGDITELPLIEFFDDTLSFQNDYMLFSNLRDIGCVEMPFIMTKETFKLLKNIQ